MKKKQNLVILANPFVNSKGFAGGDLYYIELANYLKKKYQVSIILPLFAKKHWPRKLKFLTLKRNPFDESEKRIFIFAAYLIRAYQSYRLLRNFPAKTIVCSSSDFFPDVLPVYFAKLRGKNFFWVSRFYHLVNLSNKNINKLENLFSFALQRISCYLAIKKSDLILVDNLNTLNFFKEKGIKEESLLLSGGSVDFKKLPRLKSDQERIYDAVFAGRLDYTKGIFDLPKIWSQVIKAIPSAKLAIAGTATLTNQRKLQNLIRMNGIEKNVRLFGFLPHKGKKTLFDVFAQSKIFLSLTLEGGRDFALIEAMAYGLPIIAYDQPFLREGTINKGFLLAKKGDYIAVSKSIVHLLQNPKIRMKLAKLALKDIENLDWKHTFNILKDSFSALN